VVLAHAKQSATILRCCEWLPGRCYANTSCAVARW